MKETSSSVWSFQMIIIFMLIFAGFLALVLTYSKAFAIKNRFLSIIEKYDGITEESLDIMNNYARNNGYKAKAHCTTREGVYVYGVIIHDDVVEVAREDQYYNYCFSIKTDHKGLTYYDLEVFYKFNLPFFQSLGLYRIEGHTNSFTPADNIINKEE